MQELDLAKQIALKVKEAGGNTYFVGGYVRDRLLCIPNKDIDIEVHGITKDKLEAILDLFGKRLEIGESFGIYNIARSNLDIALPRKERQIGLKHQDFSVDVDPFCGTYKAAIRRDFTINALMEDVLTGEVIDHFNGLSDLKNKIIRHVNDKTFVEDSLRLLRGCQFASRFEFSIASETIDLCKTIDLTNLPKERINAELEKALLKANKPSIFFECLREMDKLDYWFKEVKALIGVKQNEKYHQEGDVWVHTMMVLDSGAKYRALVNKPYYYMLSCLAHDFGKVVATTNNDGIYHAINHEIMGIPLVEEFIKRISLEKDLLRYVKEMVRGHMMPNIYAEANSKIKSTNKMFDCVTYPVDLIYLAQADRSGQITEEEKIDTLPYLMDRLNIYNEYMARPYVTGNDLIELGYKPGKSFNEALRLAHNYRLTGVRKEEAIKQIIYFLKNN